jgi:hypothetical protein
MSMLQYDLNKSYSPKNGVFIRDFNTLVLL